MKSFLALSESLKKDGYEPVFIFTEQERKEYHIDFETPQFSSLGDLAAYVAESGYMIGNDSGIGHLASCLGLPTLTLCRSQLTADFWRPAWSPGRVLTPSPYIPNLKGLRWRDRHWKKWISVRRAAKAFKTLSQNPISS
jgi:ADP-heptose:LPS heptosyltransferase